MWCTNLRGGYASALPLRGYRSHVERVQAIVHREIDAVRQDLGYPPADRALTVACRVCAAPIGRPCRRVAAHNGTITPGDASVEPEGHEPDAGPARTVPHRSRALDAAGQGPDALPVHYRSGRRVETLPEL